MAPKRGTEIEEDWKKKKAGKKEGENARANDRASERTNDGVRMKKKEREQERVLVKHYAFLYPCRKFLKRNYVPIEMSVS